jgi:surface antigen
MKTGKKLFLCLMAAQISAPGIALAENKQTSGAIIGGILGGLLMNSNSSANNRDFNTIVGILGGVFIGSAIGRDMDRRDQEALAAAKQRSLEQNRMEEWNGRSRGSNTGAYGSIRVVQTGFHRQTGEMCRRYESSVTTNRGSETFEGVSCMSRSGQWREVNEGDVRFDSHSVGTAGSLPGQGGGIIPGTPTAAPDYNRGQNNQQQHAPRKAKNHGITSQNQNASAELEITRITRRAGGEYFAIDFADPVQLERIEIQVLDGQLNIHRVAFATERGFQFQARQLSNTGRVFTGRMLVSENLRNAGRVTGIEIQAESMGSLADIRVRVVGAQQSPELYLGYGKLK